MEKASKTLVVLAVLASLAIAACGPSQDELEAACLASCVAQADCGLYAANGLGCFDNCKTNVADLDGQTADCAWVVSYWWDCLADTSCDEFLAPDGTICVADVLDVLTYCEAP